MKRLAIACVLLITGFCPAAQAVSSAEFYTTAAYQYGRFEARVQYAAGDGVVSSFFLWKDGSEVAGAFWNELDFEKVGADCHVETNPLYGNPLMLDPERFNSNLDLCGVFHTYAYEWTPDYIAWLVDGVEIRRETGAVASAFSQNATQGMQIRFNIWPGDASFGGNFNPAILPVHQYINWVSYSSYESGAFNPVWREDFTNNAMPSGWASATWASPKNLSTHTTANISFINGYAVLSLTADGATGPAGAMPMDPGDPPTGSGGTSSGSGGTPPGSGGTSSGSGGTSSGSGGTPSGSGGMPAASGGGPAGSGGLTSNGGAGGAQVSAAGSGASSPVESADDSGCGCRLTPHGSRRVGVLVVLAAVIGSALGRRKSPRRR